MENSKRLKVLTDICAMKTINGDEKLVADYLSDLFKESAISSSFLEYGPNRANLITEIGSKTSEKVLAFSGHMDVVDPGNLSEWVSDPFKPEVRDGNLYGRGTCDMKSGLAAMAIAMIELTEEQVPLNGRIRLLGTVGEEVGELGAEQLTKEGYVDDVTSMIIGEPTGYEVVYTHKGSINFQVDSKGKSSHSSMPQLGINAIDHLVDFYTQANQAFRKEVHTDEVLGDFIYNVTLISGGEQINSIPDSASLQGNIRTIPEYDNAEVIQKMQDIIDALNKEATYTLTLTINANKISVKSQKDSEIALIAKSVAEAATKQEVPLGGISPTTDAAEFIKAPKEFPIIVFGPGNDTPHQVNEYVNVQNYLDMIDIYKEIAKKYLA